MGGGGHHVYLLRHRDWKSTVDFFQLTIITTRQKVKKKVLSNLCERGTCAQIRWDLGGLLIGLVTDCPLSLRTELFDCFYRCLVCLFLQLPHFLLGHHCAPCGRHIREALLGLTLVLHLAVTLKLVFTGSQ